MKQTLFFVIAFLSLQIMHAQDVKESAVEPFFEMKDVDEQPEFPGGIDNFYNFFYKNLSSDPRLLPL